MSNPATPTKPTPPAKLCKDCKWLARSSPQAGFPECRFPASYDPVFGNAVYMTAAMNRASGPCGPTAKNFEPMLKSPHP